MRGKGVCRHGECMGTCKLTNTVHCVCVGGGGHNSFGYPKLGWRPAAGADFEGLGQCVRLKVSEGGGLLGVPQVQGAACR